MNFKRRSVLVMMAWLLSACGVNDVVTSTPTVSSPRIQGLPPAPESATVAPLGVTVVSLPTPAPSPPSSPAPSFDANTCPLTGLPASSVDWSQRRAVLVQIGNSPPENPQSQLSFADVVFEHVTEGGITRFSAIYLCNDAATRIGPVRSGRLINLENVPMMNAIFVHVGASDEVLAKFAESDANQAKFDEYTGDPGVFRVPERKPPFNAYTSVQEIWSLARQRGWIPAPRVTALKFGTPPPVGGPAAQIDLPIGPGVAEVSYTYDVASGLYRRSMNGFPHVDLATSQQLTMANVLVIYAQHTETDIIEDSLGSHSIQIDLTGGGRAQLLRDGLVFEGRWARPEPHDFFDLKDASGIPLLLKAGVTWIEVVPADFQVTIK